jgi:hypothetical protein
VSPKLLGCLRDSPSMGMPEVTGISLRRARGCKDVLLVAKVSPRWAQDVLEDSEVCSRGLKCALSEYEMAEVCLRWLRHALGRYEVASLCPG